MLAQVYKVREDIVASDMYAETNQDVVIKEYNVKFMYFRD